MRQNNSPSPPEILCSPPKSHVLLSRKIVLSVSISLKKSVRVLSGRILLYVLISPQKKKSLACSLWPLFIWKYLPSIGYSISFFNAHGYGKRIHGGSLGDSLKDAAVSYLVSDQILTMLTFLSRKTKKNLLTAHHMRVVHKVATSYLFSCYFPFYSSICTATLHPIPSHSVVAWQSLHTKLYLILRQTRWALLPEPIAPPQSNPLRYPDCVSSPSCCMGVPNAIPKMKLLEQATISVLVIDEVRSLLFLIQSRHEVPILS